MNKKSVLLMAAMAVSTSASAAAFGYKDMIGKWRVTGVQLANDGAIQALVENDPLYMGAELQFSADGIVWLKGSGDSPGEHLQDNCYSRPHLTPADDNDPDAGYRVAGGFNVICGDTVWGPGSGAVIKPGNTQTVQLYWYDNGVLTLTKTS